MIATEEDRMQMRMIVLAEELKTETEREFQETDQLDAIIQRAREVANLSYAIRKKMRKAVGIPLLSAAIIQSAIVAAEACIL